MPRFSLEFPAFLCCHTQPHSRTSASNHFSNTTLDNGQPIARPAPIDSIARQASQQQRRRTWLTDALLPLNAVRPRIDRTILHKSKPTARAVCLSKREVGTYKTKHNSSCSYSSNGDLAARILRRSFRTTTNFKENLSEYQRKCRSERNQRQPHTNKRSASSNRQTSRAMMSLPRQCSRSLAHTHAQFEVTPAARAVTGTESEQQQPKKTTMPNVRVFQGKIANFDDNPSIMTSAKQGSHVACSHVQRMKRAAGEANSGVRDAKMQFDK